jgi:hypothetical protein
MIEVCLGTLKLDRFRKALNRLIKVPFTVKADAFVVVGEGISRID